MKDLESLQTAEQSLMDLQERWVGRKDSKPCYLCGENTVGESVIWACTYTFVCRLVHQEWYVHLIFLEKYHIIIITALF